MHSSRTFGALTVALFLTSVSEAQTPTHLKLGDIVVAADSLIGVMDGDGVNSNGFDSPSNTFVSLWDPANPDQIISGSGSNSSTGGYLLRHTFTSSTEMATQQLVGTGQFAYPNQISWDQSGDNLILVTNTDQVHSVNATTGAVTDLTSGSQPWGTASSCGAMDPLTGDIYVGNTSGELWRIASGGGPATLHLTGLGNMQKILFDCETLPHYLYVASSDRFGRVDLNSTPEVEWFFGEVGQSALSPIYGANFDQDGNFVLVISADRVYTLENVEDIPIVGVPPQFLGQFSFPSSSQEATDITVVGETIKPFRLTVESVPILGANVVLENPPTPVGVGWIYFSASTFLPADSGPFYGLFPDLLTLSIMDLPLLFGGPLAFFGAAPSGFQVGQFGMAPFAGQTWDGVSVIFSPSGQFLGRTNLERVTWQ